MYRIVAKKYPNNEIRVRLESRGSGKPFSYEEEEVEVAEATPSDSGSPDPSLLLDIRPDFETPIKPLPSGFGSMPRKTEFGLNGKNTLLRLGGVFDKLGCKPENFVFLTGTLPGSTKEAMDAIARWSGWLVHRLKAWLNKYQKGERLDFYVWERQKRGALHLHYCLYCPDSGQRQRILERFKSQWIRLLDSIGKSSNTDMFARSEGGTWANFKEVTQAYAQEVYKSVVAYLAKYCSKEAGKDSGGEYYPSRWWGCSRSCTKHLREMAEEFEIDALSRSKGEALFEEYTRTLDVHTNKCHTYRDKVGSGINTVAYTHKEELDSIWIMIAPKRNLTEREQSLLLLKDFQQWISLVLTSRYLRHRFSVTLSGLALTLAGKWETSMPLNFTEMAMLADACSYLCRLESRSYQCPKYLKRKIESLVDSGVRWNECTKVSTVPQGSDQANQGGVPTTDKSDDNLSGMRYVQLPLADCGWR